MDKNTSELKYYEYVEQNKFEESPVDYLELTDTVDKEYLLYEKY